MDELLQDLMYGNSLDEMIDEHTLDEIEDLDQQFEKSLDSDYDFWIIT